MTSKRDDANIKLADFGFARSVQNGYVSTKCGTLDYVAPEVLYGKPHGTVRGPKRGYSGEEDDLGGKQRRALKSE